MVKTFEGRRGLYRVTGLPGIWRIWSRSERTGHYFLHPWNTEASDHNDTHGRTREAWIEAHTSQLNRINHG